MKQKRSKPDLSKMSLDEFVDYFDNNDLGEVWDQLKEVKMDVNIKRVKYVFTVEEKVGKKIFEIALKKKTSPQKLINLWLSEKIAGN